MTRCLIIALCLLVLAAAYAYMVQPGQIPSAGGSFTPRDELIQMNER